MIIINNNKGYIALTSIIIVSILSLTIVLSMNFSGFFNRFNILDSEFKETSFALAEACANKALLKLAQNSSYLGNENINVGFNTCSILAIENNGSQKIIKTKAQIKNAVSNLKVVINTPNFNIVSWTEEPIL